MANHLLIGLGGTGGKILRSMRKRIYEEFDSNTLTENTKLEYIYVDSDPKDLNDNGSWNYMGSPVHLSASQKVNINGIGGGVLNNLNAYPGLRAFISEEDRDLMQNDQMLSIIDAGIGGQRRRFGRILIANNVTNDPNNGFSAVLRDRIIEMTTGQGVGTITFHICAGLAGGTGSGSVIDAIAQLHKIIAPMGKAFDVYLYLYVPEILVPEEQNQQGFYHANGYAALQEINALALGNYRPVDISGAIDNRTGKVKRLIDGNNAKPFKRAYLFTDRNEDDRVLDKEEKLPSAVADFLFQRIVASEKTVDTKLQRVIEAENAGTAPEKDESDVNVHARDFMTFGITRIEYPESEVKIYATEKSVESTLTALMYNTWIDRRGFAAQSDEEAGIGLTTEVKLPDTEVKLWLSYEHLTLQMPIENFAGTEDWNNYDTYWTNYCSFFANDVLESEENDRRNWAARFLEILTMEFDSNFRGLGVKGFFKSQKEQKEVKRYASVVCKHIERTIFNEWINGKHGEKPMSLQKARLYLNALEDSTRERIPKIDALKANLMGLRDQKIDDAKRQKAKLEDVGWFRHLVFDKAKQYFLQYSSDMGEYYALETKIESCDFAKLLLEEVVTRIHSMSKYILLLHNMFKQAAAVAAAEAEGACQTQNEYASQEVQFVDKRFDPNDVRNKVEEELLSDEELQQRILSESLQQFKDIVEKSGKESLFGALYELMGGVLQTLSEEERAKAIEKTNVILDFVGNNSRSYIVQKMEKAGEEDHSKKLLGVNILEKIQQECPTDPQLESYIKEMVGKAKSFLQFNNGEFGRGQNGATPMHQYVQICLPEYNDPTNFRDKFINLLRGCFAGTIYNEKSIATNYKPNQIVIIMLKADFPLRFVQNINFLYDQYQNMTSVHNNHSKLNKVLLHTESLSSDTLPSLFEEDPDVLQKRMELLAIKLHSVPELVGPGIDPKTKDPISVIKIGEGFKTQVIEVGADVVKTAKMLAKDPQKRKTLSEYIDGVIAEKYVSSAEKQEFCKLIENMICDVVLPQCNNNMLDPLFSEYRTVAEDYFKSI